MDSYLVVEIREEERDIYTHSTQKKSEFKLLVVSSRASSRESIILLIIINNNNNYNIK